MTVYIVWYETQDYGAFGASEPVIAKHIYGIYSSRKDAERVLEFLGKKDSYYRYPEIEEEHVYPEGIEKL